jgi:hypothetical protein
MFAEDSCVFLVVFFGWAHHFHAFEYHYVGVFLQKGADDGAVSEIFIEIWESSLFKEHLSDGMLAPEEEDAFGLRAEVGELKIVAGYFW